MSPLAHFLVHFAFFYTCVEGLVINILYPAKLPFIYKDLILLFVYILVLLPNLERVLNPPPLARTLTGTLALFIGLLLVYILVPSPTNLLSELVAVKQRIFYMPLLIVGYYFVRSGDDLRRLLTAMAVYAIGVSLFGIYLFFAGPAGLQRLGGSYAAVFYTPTGASDVSVWRVPGTFTSSGQYGAYLSFNAIAIAALLTIPRIGRWTRIVAGVAMVLVILAMLASGSRASLIVASASLSLAFLMSGRIARMGLWGIALYTVLAYGFVVLGPGVQDRFDSIASAEHVTRFQRTYFGQLFLSPLLENPLGAGLGVATIGARHFSEFYQVVLMESYFGILAVEMGWPGLLAFFSVVLAIVALVVRNRTMMARAPEGLLWLGLVGYVLLVVLLMPVSTSIDHAPSNFYFWFSVGALVRMIELEHWRQWAITTGAQPEWIATGEEQEPTPAAASG